MSRQHRRGRKALMENLEGTLFFWWAGKNLWHKAIRGMQHHRQFRVPHDIKFNKINCTFCRPHTPAKPGSQLKKTTQRRKSLKPAHFYLSSTFEFGKKKSHSCFYWGQQAAGGVVTHQYRPNGSDCHRNKATADHKMLHIWKDNKRHSPKWYKSQHQQPCTNQKGPTEIRAFN